MVDLARLILTPIGGIIVGIVAVYIWEEYYTHIEDTILEHYHAGMLCIIGGTYYTFYRGFLHMLGIVLILSELFGENPFAYEKEDNLPRDATIIGISLFIWGWLIGAWTNLYWYI